MTELGTLDRTRIRELFDLRGPTYALLGGSYHDDPYPVWHRLREQAPVHPGVLHELTGFEGPAMFVGLPEPDREHFTTFSYEACEAVYRAPETFAQWPDPVDPAVGELSPVNSMLFMNGPGHKRYRGLVQPSFVPSKAQWWIRNWVEEAVHTLIDGIVEDGHAELNVDFCAAIPVLTITGSFGIPVERALDVRAAILAPMEIVEILTPIVESRRANPQDDLISILVHAEMKDEDGTVHRLSDAEIYSFALLLLAAGSGTTWKQMGITLHLLLQRPELLAAVREDREALRLVIKESLRWMPTDPMFSRYTTKDVDFYGVHMPKGSVVHINLAAANRDPARWDRPDEFDIYRAQKPTFAFGSGPHVCLGMHVAFAELTTAIGALLDRLPNLRLDPAAESPRIIGMYERAATEIPVLFDAGDRRNARG
ncbi:Biotin biosynthesis cytochrome P450 [Mycolicibacterium vanbaalenii]|uniref:Biotin biosynthesis cytochrome P450 n=2 Tax=Mycolicibacterium vanbaalenii TaxID=110539 RepID=A0A5S9QYD3_MYCVN|nr:Biotin biosynthesis cytochrome P450 [Mycolicibacterium vanbaalenii]